MESTFQWLNMVIQFGFHTRVLHEIRQHTIQLLPGYVRMHLRRPKISKFTRERDPRPSRARLHPCITAMYSQGNMIPDLAGLGFTLA